MGKERLGPSYFFISLELGPLNNLLWYVPSSRYVELGSSFLFLQEQINDIIITNHYDDDDLLSPYPNRDLSGTLLKRVYTDNQRQCLRAAGCAPPFCRLQGRLFLGLLAL